MASLITYDGGLRRIDFTMTPHGPRRSVRLGRINAKAAKSIHAKLEIIMADKMQSRPHDAEVSQWLTSLDEKLLSRIRAVGLADGVGVTQILLGDFLQRFKNNLNVKPGTEKFYDHTIRNLRDHFGAGRLLNDITESDADIWRTWLREDQGLANATVARRVTAARTVWRKAVRWNLVNVNPFEGIKGGSQQNESRKQFISADVIHAIIDTCPDGEWRLLIGLSRWGGLRCPSEHLALTWDDVDWERGTIRVRSAKTEHRDGHAVRIVPMFPELRPLLMDAFDAASDGTTHVITGYRDSTTNLRTQFHRIIKRAGFEPWPRLWQNLRASRESELMRDYDLSTACKWIGNSPAVAAKHYAMSTDLSADFQRAIQIENTQQNTQQKAQQPATASDGQGMPTNCEMPVIDDKKPNGTDMQPVAISGKTKKWAVQDSNTC